FRGWALAEQGQGEDGLTQIRQGQAARRVVGAKLGRSHSLALQAEMYGKVGQAEEGLILLTDALVVGERHYEAELYRLKGQLTLQQKSRVGNTHHAGTVGAAETVGGAHPTEEEAEACFLKAIEIARKQQAKSLELRAVMSLSRLWQQQGKKEEARQMLAEIYGWFTEGFDTRDLQEAKALLEELGG